MKKNLLQHINNPQDLRKIPKGELKQLAQELRAFIIEIISVKKGHLGASLGVVELTLALHYVFNTPEDLLVWDVGHQAYPHKILTGRKSKFHTNRQFKGIAGFPKRAESEYDTFGVGHSSTSISAALGMAIASRLKGDTEKHHIAVIGDASIASGMAFEGLNHAGVAKSNLLIILNDNEMGIDPNVGALKEYLTAVKKGMDADQKNIFEALNFTYHGPVDGHDLNDLINVLEALKKEKGPKFLHVITTKGKGLSQAEKDQVTYHAPGSFNKDTGELLPKNNEKEPPKYQDIFGLTLVELARDNEKIIGITPAMPTGSSLKYMINEFPERAFDVGIAEQHAVTLAAGIATQGLIPFCAIYSTFLQRAYDQVIHDVAIQNLPVVFCIDRAGLVGEDGPTHHGVFDLAYLRLVPNLVIFAPLDAHALRCMLYTAQKGIDFPLAIRYPRGQSITIDWKCDFKAIEIGKGRCMQKGNGLAILSIGSIGWEVKEMLEQIDYQLSWYDMQFVKPLDEELLHQIFKSYKKILIIEDGTVVGGFGTAILEFANNSGYKDSSVKTLGIPDEFIEHGDMSSLKEMVGLDVKNIKKEVLKLLEN